MMLLPLPVSDVTSRSAPGGPAPSLDATPFERPHANRRTREIINHLRLTNWRFTTGGRRPDIRRQGHGGSRNVAATPKPIYYDDREVIHACDSAIMDRYVRLVWAKCDRQVPAISV
jgi:hypothetical protein